MKVTLHHENLISMAPKGVSDWGPWQFPTISKVDDILYLEFHIESDSAESYGKDKAKYYSNDLGATWTETNKIGGIKLDNDTIIAPYAKKPIDIRTIKRPPVIKTIINYGHEYYFHKFEDIDPIHKSFYISIKKNGKWNVEKTEVESNGLLSSSTQTVLPISFFWQFTKGLNNNIYAPLYKLTHKIDEISKYSNAIFYESSDFGKSFKKKSIIEYSPPYENDELSEKRYGFTEPNIVFVDGNNAFTLLRTTDGNGIGPMYISWTTDNLKTWSKPEYFDDLGVWPQGVTLDNKVSVVGYGRPGLFIKFLYKKKWSGRVEIVPPKEYQTETCSYCAITPIDHNKILIVYSRFDLLDENNKKRKAIMCRVVEFNV